MKISKEKFKTWWLRNPSLDSAEIPLPTPGNRGRWRKSVKMALYRLIAVETAPVLVARVAGNTLGTF
jgi:hypothetical protein